MIKLKPLLNTSSVTVSITHAQGVIIGEGDAGHRKDAERLAALSAVYQLNNLGIVSDKHIMFMYSVLTFE
jgi:hypothetical protein